MEVDDLPYEKMKLLLKEDFSAFSVYLRVAGFYLIIYEHLKETIIDKVRNFFSDNWRIENGELVGTPGQEYLDLVKGKPAFRACRDFHLEMNAITKEDDDLIDRFIRYRGEVAHRLFAILLDDDEPSLDPKMLFEVVALTRKIDNWWLVNFEFSVDPDFDWENADTENAISGRQLFLTQLLRVGLKDLVDSVDQTAAKAG